PASGTIERPSASGNAALTACAALAMFCASTLEIAYIVANSAKSSVLKSAYETSQRSCDGLRIRAPGIIERPRLEQTKARTPRASRPPPGRASATHSRGAAARQDAG